MIVAGFVLVGFGLIGQRDGGGGTLGDGEMPDAAVAFVVPFALDESSRREIIGLHAT